MAAAALACKHASPTPLASSRPFSLHWLSHVPCPLAALRYSELFCGNKGSITSATAGAAAGSGSGKGGGSSGSISSGGAAEPVGCSVQFGVLGYEASDFMIIAYTSTHAAFDALGKSRKTAASLLCAAGCEWRALGDGVCNPQCNTSSCFYDRQDCAAGATGCSADCHPTWIGDGYCDEACFNARCKWDKRDCLDHGQKACGDSCMPSLLGDGECDAPCNTATCSFDEGDCFHGHTECYQRPDAADYRGMVGRTKAGVTCQKWTDQAPQAHTKTHGNFPRAGLGGHNFCRNPDGNSGAWCFTTDESVRWDFCDVGVPSAMACYSPPSPMPPPPKTNKARFASFVMMKDKTASEIVSAIRPAP